MVNRVKVLEPKISNMIAAGEVVERPASVIKELIENSIDAGATNINIEIKKGGISYIRVTDNGIGIDKEDAKLAFMRHATSKISTEKDLNSISTLGFRGEALASIAAVSHVELITKTNYSEEGVHIIVKGGKVVSENDIGCPQGTTLVVKNLFYNTPARMKFLKKDSTEAGYVGDVVLHMVLSHPEISFRYINNGKESIYTSGDGDLLNCIYTLYGREYSKAMITVNHSENGIIVEGAVGKPSISRPNRTMQNFFVNGRYVKSKLLTVGLEEAYKNLLTINKFPAAVINIKINPQLMDINIHPAKLEVKFSDDKSVYEVLYWAVKNALYSETHIPEIIVRDTKKNEEDEIDIRIPLEKYNRKQNTDPENKIETNINQQSFVKEENGNEAIIDDFKIIGQVFGTYIVIEKNEELLLIDQHAAHERFNYEELLEKYKNRDVYSQVLISPVVVELSREEAVITFENIDFLKTIGFEVEDFGNNSVLIRQAPFNSENKELKALFLEIIELLSGQKESKISEIEYKALYSIACKASIRANSVMHTLEMKELVRKLLSMDNINTCPHGRPITISLTKRQIEKEFKRIV
jgi:DNA mismatch repair protein MutL